MRNLNARIGSLSFAAFLSHVRNPLYRGGYALTISSAITSCVGFAYWLVAARFYPADIVGTNSAAIAAMTFLAALATLYLDGTAVRFIPRSGWATARLVGISYLLIMVMAAAAAGIFLAGLVLWSPNLGLLNRSGWMSAGFVVATVMLCIFSVQDSVLTGLRKATWVPVENAIYAALKLGLLIAFSFWLPEYGILASWTIPTVLLIIPISYYIFGHAIPQHERQTHARAVPFNAAQVAKYAIANYIGTLFYFSYNLLPPILVLELVGNKASAYFYVPWIIASFLRLVATNMSTSLTVEGSINHDQVIHYFRHALSSTARLVIPVVIVLLLGASFLLRFFGESYATEGATLLRLLALSTLPNIVVFLYLGLLRVQNRVKSVIAVHGSIAITTLGLSYIFIHSYGITGVGLAWLATQTVAAIIIWATQLRPILGHSASESRVDGATEPVN